MSIVPKNSIIENQYTLGSEFSKKNVGGVYQGYYCIVGNKYYTGRTYTNTSIELVKIVAPNPITSSFNSSFPNNRFDERYFAKKINFNPILIREINKESFITLSSDPFYQTLSINGIEIFSGSKALDQANQQMPGLKAFILG